VKDTTKKMLDEINDAHDFDTGQVYSNGGTEYHSTDTCRVCGLRRHWKSDRQNGIEDQYRFSDSETGEDLTLRQAVTRGCA
jgi:hypothetical protein